MPSKDKYSMDLKNSDHEASMAKAELVQVAKNAIALLKMIKEGDNLDGWVSSHITIANDHLNSVHEHMEYQMANDNALEKGPREFEESMQHEIKSSLTEQWLEKKYQGR
jgi:hypothetical protein